MPLRLAAWRGQEPAAIELFATMLRGARARREGCAITAAHHAMAILYNGLGRYDQAVRAARQAAAPDALATSSWALGELVEAASRSGRMDLAAKAAEQLAERTGASTTAWAMGTGARARALVADGAAAESLHREALECLGETGMAAPLARARPSSPWGPRASPTGPGASCRPPGRRSASAATTAATSSLPRRSRSRAWPATA
jgi:tetratricopeptide (TPR) repeat protein